MSALRISKLVLNFASFECLPFLELFEVHWIITPFKPTSGRFLPNTPSWVSSDRERGLMVHHCYHVVDALQCSAVGARVRTFSHAARVFAYKSGPSCVYRVDKPLWPRARPLLRDLTSVPAARATMMSWHGQAKQPMMLRGQSVSAGVPDAQGPSLWSSVGAKDAGAAVWPQSM